MNLETVDLLIKPTIGCNARCVYCHAIKPDESAPVMSQDLLTGILTKYGEFTRQQGISYATIIWHGGEPLKAGADFYYHVGSVVKEHLGHLNLMHQMFSNACLYKGRVRQAIRELLTDRSISVSFDPFHPTRLHTNGTSNFVDSLRGMQQLIEDGFAVSLVYVVHGKSLERVRDLYYFFKNCGAAGVSLFPADFFDHPEYGLSVENWADFLKEMWNVWEEDDYAVGLSFFEHWLESLRTHRLPESCEYGVRERSAPMVMISPEGKIFTCHVFMDQGKNCLGDIRDMSFEEILKHPLIHQIAETKENMPDECRTCTFLQICNTGCVAAHNETGRTVWCEGLKEFYAHMIERQERYFEMHPQGCCCGRGEEAHCQG